MHYGETPTFGPQKVVYELRDKKGSVAPDVAEEVVSHQYSPVLIGHATVVGQHGDIEDWGGGLHDGAPNGGQQDQ
jgi:hypothetical protein